MRPSTRRYSAVACGLRRPRAVACGRVRSRAVACAVFRAPVRSSRSRRLFFLVRSGAGSSAVFRGPTMRSSAVECGSCTVVCGRVRSSAVVCGRVRSCVRSCARVRSLSCGREQILLEVLLIQGCTERLGIPTNSTAYTSVYCPPYVQRSSCVSVTLYLYSVE